MNRISEILSFKEFEDHPPVLVDIGASGPIRPEWRKIARYCVCVGADADQRDFEHITKNKYGFQKLHIINKILAENEGHKYFYLTQSPHCSSLLPPNFDRLKDWSFCELFRVKKVAELEAVSLPAILKRLSLNYIDWFKTDSQGTDLRLLQSLGPKMISNLIIAEFEPGIMDAYTNEDKMHAVMAFMEKHPFWLSDLLIKGPQRISHMNFKNNFSPLEQRFFSCFLKESAFWGEMAYINTFENQKFISKRNVLLGWVFSTIKKQHGFALELAQLGKRYFSDPIFIVLKSESVRSIKRNRWKLPFFLIKKAYIKFLQISYLTGD